MEQTEMPTTNDKTPTRRQRTPKPTRNGGIEAASAKKRGRKSKAVQANEGQREWDLVLTNGKRGKLTLPADMSTEDVEAVQMQLKPIFELSSVQAGIAAVDG